MLIIKFGRMQTQQVNLSLLRALPADLQQQVATAAGVCLDCGEKLFLSADDETACPACGVVWDADNVASYTPFPEANGEPFESHWSPTTAIAPRKALGDTTAAYRGKLEMKVLAMRSAVDVGLRARYIQFLTTAEEPSQLRRVLGKLSSLLLHLGLGDNHAAAEYAGNLCRRLVAFLLLSKLTVHVKLADAIAMYVVKQLNITADLSILNANENDVALVAWFAETTQRFKRLALHYAQKKRKRSK
ncbi:MAG: transposase [Candidatus Bathyarchaeota archaeon]|nr:transposase [Candidatus Bathyarchaeota archaeon]